MSEEKINEELQAKLAQIAKKLHDAMKGLG
jgi:hypothetical protein